MHVVSQGNVLSLWSEVPVRARRTQHFQQRDFVDEVVGAQRQLHTATMGKG